VIHETDEAELFPEAVAPRPAVFILSDNPSTSLNITQDPAHTIFDR